MGFAESVLAQDYSYLLTINSLSESEQNFNVEIKSTLGPSSDQTIRQLTDQITPYEMTLESGEHEITVKNTNEQGRIESKIIGFRNGDSKGLVSCDDNRALLKAGPRGHLAASGY